MKLQYQKGSWDCGPTCLRNSLILLGRNVEWDSVVQWTEASEDGTCGASLLRALKWLKVDAVEYSSSDVRRSWNRLIFLGSPAMLCVDGDSHWITVVSGNGRRVVVWDPLPNAGLQVYGRAEFLKRWINSQKRMYGIFICASSS